jgi:hypothetical protein
VLHRGRIEADFDTKKTNVEQVGYLMLEGKDKEDAKEIR